MMVIDLHTHSTYSDGTLSPLQLVIRAKKKKISVLSLTDHDTLDGLNDFSRACIKHGIKGIRGVELSARYPSTLHILGYRIGKDTSALEEKLAALRCHRNERNRIILEKLLQKGIKISYEELLREAGGDVIARPHFARILVRKGYSRNMHAAFMEYLARGASAYVDRVKLSPRECIDAITQSGGLPVLAHPSQTTLDEESLLSILAELKEMGLWGMECVYPGYSSQAILRYLQVASRMDLFPTAGTDFHGNNRQGTDLGMLVRDDFLPWARLNVTL